MPDSQNNDDALRTAIIGALRTVHDPEIPINIYDLGLVYDISIDDDAFVDVKMTLTAPNCPMAEVIHANVEKAVKSVDGVKDAAIELVWEPTWNADMMSEAAKLELEFTGHTGPAHLRKSKFTTLSMNKSGRRPPRR